MAAKQLELLRMSMPVATRVGVLINPTNPSDSETTLREIQVAAPTMGLQIQVFHVSSNREINEAFASIARARPDALLVGAGPPFSARRVQLVQLAARHAIPAIYAGRQNVEIGGLMSYGASLTDAYRQVGMYAGKFSGAPSRGFAGGAVEQVRTGYRCRDCEELGLTSRLAARPSR